MCASLRGVCAVCLCMIHNVCVCAACVCWERRQDERPCGAEAVLADLYVACGGGGGRALVDRKVETTKLSIRRPLLTTRGKEG